MRLTGKRQIGELQLSELITALLLSELATGPVINNNMPVLHAVIPILTLISLEIVNTFIVTKSMALRKFFDGTPSILIRRGELDQKELAKARMTLNELCAELRLCNVADISEVEYAILEQNGKLSVFPKAANQPLRPVDMQIEPQERGVAHALIIDGKVSECNLTLAGKTEAWLLRRIEKLRCPLRDVFYFSVDDAGGEYLIRKNIR